MPISDNQEVFTNVDNGSQLIIEILEMSEVPDSEAVSYLYTDLAECNKAEDVIILQQRKLETSDLPKLKQPELVGYVLEGT